MNMRYFNNKVQLIFYLFLNKVINVCIIGTGIGTYWHLISSFPFIVSKFNLNCTFSSYSLIFIILGICKKIFYFSKLHFTYYYDFR